MENSLTNRVISHIEEVYGAGHECPWESSPQNRIFRNKRNGKWFALIMGGLPLSRLGIAGDKSADVMNLKCDPLLSFNVVDNVRVFPAYHMNKEHWISVVLSDDMSMEEIGMLIDMSYDLVDKGKK